MSEDLKTAAKRRTKSDALSRTARAALALNATRDKKLSDDQVALITLHIASGRSLRSVCRSLGKAEGWGSQQFQKPEVQRFAAATAMNALGVEAARSIRAIAELRDQTEDERMRFQASVELMDRAGLGNTTQARATAQTHQFTFTSKGDGSAT